MNECIELEPMYNVPTEELEKSFPITYETPAEKPLEKKVQNRLLNGFHTWNAGYDAWKHWGEVLYTKDSIYNVHGVRFTLPEYQMAMNIGLKAIDMQMGRFNNMILCDDWTAIRYEVHNTNRQTGEEKDTTVMEFVNFADHGDKGAKVVEGWGGVKGPDYYGMQHFQTPEEQANQQAFTDSILNTVLADTEDLQKKYPVVYPTAIPAGDGEKMRDFVLGFIDAWNGGAESFSSFAGDFLTEDGVYNADDTDYTREGLLSHSVDVIEKTKEERVRINNILVSDYWAAAHYYSRVELPDGSRDIKESMEFRHFVKGDKGLMVDRLWLKSGKD